MSSTRDLDQLADEAEQRAFDDDGPRRPRSRTASFLLVLAIVVGLFSVSFPVRWAVSSRGLLEGPFTDVDHNWDEDWVDMEGVFDGAIVLEDGRRLVYVDDAEIPTDFEKVRPYRYEQKIEDGVWEDHASLAVEFGEQSGDEFHVTVWHRPLFHSRVEERTWNPFLTRYRVWQMHHTATVRMVSSD